MNRQSWNFEVTPPPFRKTKPSPNLSTSTASTTGHSSPKNSNKPITLPNAPASNAGKGGTTISTPPSIKNHGPTTKKKDSFNYIKFTAIAGKIYPGTLQEGTHASIQNR